MRKKILIADDNHSILEVVTIILESEGFEVVSTTNPNDILKQEGKLPDLILLDVWMSGVNGKHICQQLKSSELAKNIPVLLMSANTDLHTITEEAGADGYIAKPFEIEYLVSKIKSYLDSDT